jgi:hypothetical protein
VGRRRRSLLEQGERGEVPLSGGALKIIKFRGDLTNHAIAVRDLDRQLATRDIEINPSSWQGSLAHGGFDKEPT